jgi:hypothetical protein
MGQLTRMPIGAPLSNPASVKKQLIVTAAVVPMRNEMTTESIELDGCHSKDRGVDPTRQYLFSHEKCHEKRDKLQRRPHRINNNNKSRVEERPGIAEIRTSIETIQFDLRIQTCNCQRQRTKEEFR